MINFQDLHLEVKDKYSFVGIRKEDSKIIFCLPKGFDINLFTTYDSKRDLFFLFYRILNHFKEICDQRGYLQSNDRIKANDRDGVVNSQGGRQEIHVPDTEEEENIFYSKLDLFNSILNAYDEPKMWSLAYRLTRTEEIDYSKVHLFLHRALYLDNGVPYIDMMSLPRLRADYQSTDIIAMYCYILVEIKQQLHEEISDEVAALAEQFKYQYLGEDQGLFQENSHKIGEYLKDILKIIDENTPIKDVDYWHFYDAIELFLYGELSQANEGEIWGIKNFYSVWESICLTYLAKEIPPARLLYLDTQFLSDDEITLFKSKNKLLDLDNAFTFDGNSKPLVPDAVLFTLPESIESVSVITLHNQDWWRDNQDWWNDYGYKTLFQCRWFDMEMDVKVAYKDQLSTSNPATFTELQKYYQSQDGSLTIDYQLPSRFYSFWKVDKDKILDSLPVMVALNHFFCVALSEGILTLEAFQEFLSFCIRPRVFETSLLRYKVDQKQFEIFSEEELYQQFEIFLNVLLQSSVLEIVDIKYKRLEEFLQPPTKKDHIKEKSIRKQFVYEYLLQRFVRKKEEFENLEIQSSFWLPSWEHNIQNDPQRVEQNYLNGYIGLFKMNFADLAARYLD